MRYGKVYLLSPHPVSRAKVFKKLTDTLAQCTAANARVERCISGPTTRLPRCGHVFFVGRYGAGLCEQRIGKALAAAHSWAPRQRAGPFM